jgi:hypothetical protein
MLLNLIYTALNHIQDAAASKKEVRILLVAQPIKENRQVVVIVELFGLHLKDKRRALIAPS